MERHGLLRWKKGLGALAVGIFAAGAGSSKRSLVCRWKVWFWTSLRGISTSLCLLWTRFWPDIIWGIIHSFCFYRRLICCYLIVEDNHSFGLSADTFLAKFFVA
jgi:hypothetical protein